MQKFWQYAAVAALSLVISGRAFAGIPFTPTTTLAAETGNNTSASDSFSGQPNGNPAPGNVSKVDTRSLLYPGATTNIYAHYMPWFGTASHVNVGYSSTDPAQIHRQVEDMVSRGIQGVIIDWYGPGKNEDTSSQLMLREAEGHPGFSVAIMEDKGALSCSDTATCTSALISQLNYVAQTYIGSPAYMRLGGRPAIFYFGVESLPVDWNSVRANVPGNPVFIFENAGGFSYGYSDGGFSWVGVSSDANNWAQSYLDGFYSTGLSTPGRHTVGSTKKGFNDSIAAWTAHRVMNQNCGQTWLSTFSEVGKYHSSGQQLESLQLVTWNDYEEGTPIEMGIDNCVSVSPSGAGSTVKWSIGGDESTIDHYTVFISTDGQSLMPVTDVPAGVRSLDLGLFGFNGGSYTAYVKAVGKPSLFNHMSGPVTVSLNGAGSPATGVDVNPASLTLPMGQSGTMTVSVSSAAGFSSPATLACAELPPGISCSFDHASVSAGASAQLTVSTKPATVSQLLNLGTSTFAFWLPGLGIGTVMLVDKRRIKRFWLGLVVLAVLALIGATGCGGIGSKSSSSSSQGNLKAATKGGTYRIVITATAGSVQRSTSAVIYIQ